MTGFRQPQSAMLVQQCTGQACHIHKNPLTMHEHLFCNMPCTSLVVFFFTKIVRKLPIADCLLQFLTGPTKTFTENWDSKAPSVGTLLAYLETTA